MVTEKLHLNDSLLLEFEARVTLITSFEKRPSMILDKTAFYGESGGQLADRGWLTIAGKRLEVVDVQFDDVGNHHHLVAGDMVGVGAGEQVSGQVDHQRRRDMMSQHTGQHLLSAVFFEQLQAETVSARLGSQIGTLDLDIAHITPEQIQAVAQRANELVMEDRQVRPLYPDQDELKAMNLRKNPGARKQVRIMEIEGFDLMPCGGTHCTRTGQIGPIHITGVERVRENLRVNFHCGRRTIDHHLKAVAMLDELGTLLGCGAAGVAENLVKLQKDLRERNQQLGQARSAWSALLVDDLHQKHPPQTEFTPIVVVREQEDLNLLRSIAGALVKRPDVVAAVAGRDPKSGDWRLIVQVGADANFNAGNWFKTTGRDLGGRGGGRPDRAEGRFPGHLDPTDFVFS